MMEAGQCPGASISSGRSSNNFWRRTLPAAFPIHSLRVLSASRGHQTVMEYAINGLSLVTAPNLASTAVRRLQSVTQSRRWQPAEAEFLFTGRAAFRKLQRIVAEFSRTAD